MALQTSIAGGKELMQIQMQPFTYTDQQAPVGYTCSTCEKKGVKLWREYQTFLEHQSLSCADCALQRAARNNKDGRGARYEGPVSADGHVTVFFSTCGGGDGDAVGRPTDQIGWLVPAVPMENGKTFWSYCAVPDDGVEWWQRLPSSSPPLPSASAVPVAG